VRLTLVRGFINPSMPTAHSILTANNESPLQTQILNAVQQINRCIFFSAETHETHKCKRVGKMQRSFRLHVVTTEL
jgi:hypothetical protein